MPSTRQTTEDLDRSWTIPAGCVAGVYASWKGIVGDKTVVEINVRWRKGQTLDPDWQIEQDGWVIEVAGRPTVTMKVGFLPPPDFEATTLEEFMVLGHIMVATPPLNAIPAVVAAAPGIVTYNDLPLILPRGVVRRDGRRRSRLRPLRLTVSPAAFRCCGLVYAAPSCGTSWIPFLRAFAMALRIGRARPANEAMSSTIGVRSRLWTKANALPVSGSAQPRVPPRPT